MISDPNAPLLPDQPPEATQLSTSLVDQSNIMLPLKFTVARLLWRITSGLLGIGSNWELELPGLSISPHPLRLNKIREAIQTSKLLAVESDILSYLTNPCVVKPAAMHSLRGGYR